MKSKDIANETSVSTIHRFSSFGKAGDQSVDKLVCFEIELYVRVNRARLIENEFKCPTIWRTAEELGIHRRREQFSKRWMWSLDEASGGSQKPEGFVEFADFA